MAHDNDALDLLETLADAGVRVTIDAGDIVCEGPLSPAMANRLRAAKPQVLALLQAIAARPASSVTVTADPGNRYEPFPLNENQQAYWLGRDSVFDGGQVGIQVFVEMEGDIDIARLSDAWNAVVAHHDMLRARILPDGTQQIARHGPAWTLPVTDLTKVDPSAAEETLATFRQTAINACSDPESGRGWDLRAVRVSPDRATVLVHIDCWGLDGRSLQILAADLARLYHEPGSALPDSELSFRDYALALQQVQEGPAYSHELAYWKGRVADLSGPPRLPIVALPAGERVAFHRHQHRLDAAATSRLRSAARGRGLTLSSVLIGAYAEVLARHSGQPRFTLNIPRWNRQPLHPDVDSIAGEFATFTMLEIDTASSPDLAGRFRALQDRLAEDIDHGLVSGVRVLREWRRANGTGPEAIIPFVFTHEPDAAADSADGQNSAWLTSFGRIAPVVQSLTQTPQVWIDAQHHTLGDTLLLLWDAQDARFPGGSVRRMFADYADLVERLANEPASWDGGHAIKLPPDQRRRRAVANDTGTAVDLAALSDALRDLTVRHPDAAAVIDCHGGLCRDQLGRAAAALARDLVSRGVGQGSRVAVSMAKGAEQVVAALAIASRGATCVPINPDTPHERLAQILGTAGVDHVLTARSSTFEGGIAIDRAALSNAPEGPWPIEELADETLHAVLFTSGSTGVPKGVMLRHDALRNVIYDGLSRFSLNESSRFLSVTPFHHDMAQFDLFGALFSGGAIVMPDPQFSRDPAHWLALCQAHRVTFWNSVPAMMGMLMDFTDNLPAGATAEALTYLRHATLGGDWIATDTGSRLKAIAPQAQLWSVGGPTETSIWNICHPVQPEDAARRSIPYGKPIANSAYRIVDPRGDDCPDGVAGEMVCSGIGVSPGYLGDPQRTAERFGTDQASGQRFYRTGDLGLYLPDGSIEFLGRADNQINLNGYRLELEEIETCLARHPAVIRAVAVAQRDGRLVRAIRVWVQGAASQDTLLAHLRDHLPPQMAPQSIYFRDSWPLTATGKVDRKRLADEVPAAVAPVFVPQGEAETLVAAAWHQILGAPVSSREANFFASGGDSVAAIRLYSALLAEHATGASVTSIFRAPTFAGLVRLLQAAPRADATPGVERIARHSGAYRATAAQARLWLDEALAERPGLYNLTFELDLAGPCNTARIGRALDQIITHWETLRTALGEDSAGQITQTVLAPWQVTVESGPLDELRHDWAGRPFDLTDGQNLRAALARIGPNHHRLLLTTHHAFVDGWSFNLLLEDFRRALDGEPVAARPLHPVDLAEWEAGKGAARMRADLDWWRQRLQRLPPAADLATGSARGEARTAAIAVANRRLGPGRMDRVRTWAREAGVTDFQYCLAAFSVLLQRRAEGSGPVLIGTHVAMRDAPGLAAMPGMLVNSLPLILDPGLSFPEAAQRVARDFSAAWQRGSVPFQEIAQLIPGRRDATRHALYGIAFTHENMASVPVHAGGLALTPEPSHLTRGALDLDVAMSDEADSGLTFRAAYRTDLFEQTTISDLLEEFEAQLLEPIWMPDEAPGEARSLVEVFDQCVALTPSAPALIDLQGQTVVTYTALADESWRIAAALTERRVEEGDTVAVLLPRDHRLIAAMLASWRVGAHFVALSPNQAAERVDLILTNAAPAAIVADNNDPRATLRPKEWADQAINASIRSQLADRRPDPVACLIYTSGTTGRPNGVEFARAALLNRLEWQWNTFPYAAGERCVARTAVEFGDYPAEIFGPLLAGVPIALIDPVTARDPAELSRAVELVGARRLLVVPSLLALLLQEDEAGAPISRMPSLQMLSTSGEALPQAHVDRLFVLRPELTVLNLYGSSETGADATVAMLTASQPQVTAGAPLSNVGLHVVDDTMRPCQPGQPGEVLITGVCLAMGYRNAPALTAERFASWKGGRIFRTGDLGVIDSNGNLKLLGRADRRVKVSGQRIELDEVHAVLSARDDISEAAVTTVDGPAGLQIVAMIAGRPAEGLRNALAARLTAAAIPSRIISVAAIPRTPGGKVDYRAVKAVFDQPAPTVSMTLTGNEGRVATIWTEVLGHPPLDATADFFDMGGHSLAAARLAARIRQEFEIAFPVRDVFAHPVLADMAARLPQPASAATNLEEFLL